MQDGGSLSQPNPCCRMNGIPVGSGAYLAEMGFLRGLFGGTAEDALDEALARPRETAAPRGLLYGKGSSSIESSEEKESDRCSRSDIGGRKDGTSPWERRKEIKLFQDSY